MHDEATTGSRPITRDEALLWLNDRLGQTVEIAIYSGRDEAVFTVLRAEGELRHWTQGRAQVSKARSREIVLGVYNLGDDASFNRGDLSDAEAWIHDKDTIEFGLSENVWLVVR